MRGTAGSIAHFFQHLRAGDRAAEPLCERFIPRLIALANKTLAGRPRRVADAEVAVQAALIAFWKQVERGQILGEARRDNLWNLLGLMTFRNALKQVRHEAAQKRGGRTVIARRALDDESGAFAFGSALPVMPTHEFDSHCEERLLQLDDDLRQFALLRLMGHETSDIARLLDCTQRKVQRTLELARPRWQTETSGVGV